MFHTIFVYLDDGSGIGRRIQAGFSVIMLLYVIPNAKCLFHKKFLIFNFGILLFVVSILITSFKIKSFYLASDYESSSHILGFFHALTLLELVVFIETLILSRNENIALNVFFKLLLLYCVLTDLIMFAGIGNFPEGYLIGNKFTVSYAHIFCAILYPIKDYPKTSTLKQLDIRKSLYLLIFAFVVSFFVDTSTGMIGSLILLLLFKFKENMFKVLKMPVIVLSLLTIFTIISFLFAKLVNYSFVKYLIVDILNRNLTLTGRTEIYPVLGNILANRPYVGFGLGNAHSVLIYNYGMANAQNGLMNVAIEQGILGAAALIVLIYFSFRKVNNSIAAPIIFLIVMYIILSSVEITLGMNFIYLLIILQIFKHNKSNQDDLIIKKNDFISFQ